MNSRNGLLLTVDYPPQRGGVPRLLDAIVRGSRDIVDWHVISMAPGDEDGATTRVADVRHLFTSAIAAGRRMRGADLPRIVCAHAFLAPVALTAAKAARIPSAGIVHGWELLGDTFRRRAPLRALRSFDSVVAVSRYSAAVVAERGVSQSRIRVVNPELPSPFTSERTIQRRGPQEGLRLVAITRLAEGYKNIEVLLRAMASLRGLVPQPHCIIVGDGPRWDALQKKAAAYGADGVVRFAGSLDDAELRKVVSSAHAGVVPSRVSITDGGFEGFGLVAQELAGAGLPVIAGNAAGLLDAAKPGWSLLFDPDDARALAAAIDTMNTDEHKRIQLAEAALAWSSTIDATYTARKFVDALWADA